MTDPTRRSFMRKAAATTAVGLGAGAAATGTVSAETVGGDRASSLLDSHADGVLSMLEADGVISDRSELSTAANVDVGGVAANREGSALLSAPGRTTELTVVTQVAEGVLTITAKPAEDRGFAVLDTGDSKVGYSVEKGRFDVGQQDIECSCINITCEPGSCAKECCTDDGDCIYDCTCNC